MLGLPFQLTQEEEAWRPSLRPEEPPAASPGRDAGGHGWMGRLRRDKPWQSESGAQPSMMQPPPDGGGGTSVEAKAKVGAMPAVVSRVVGAEGAGQVILIDGRYCQGHRPTD